MENTDKLRTISSPNQPDMHSLFADDYAWLALNTPLRQLEHAHNNTDKDLSTSLAATARDYLNAINIKDGDYKYTQAANENYRARQELIAQFQQTPLSDLPHLTIDCALIGLNYVKQQFYECRAVLERENQREKLQRAEADLEKMHVLIKQASDIDAVLGESNLNNLEFRFARVAGEIWLGEKTKNGDYEKSARIP